MISEGSCDTEDRSNDAENSALHHKNKYNLKSIKIERSYFKLQYYFTTSLFLVFFRSNNSLGVKNKYKSYQSCTNF